MIRPVALRTSSIVIALEAAGVAAVPASASTVVSFAATGTVRRKGHSLLRIVVGIAAAAAGVLTFSATASAAPGWTPTATMPALPGSSQAIGFSAFGFQTGGAETAAYVTLSSAAPVGTVLHIGVIPLGGTYQEQLTVPSANGEFPSEVYLAEAPNGAAVAAWSEISGVPGTPVSYFASYRAAGSSTWALPASIAYDATPKTTDTGIDVVPAISSDGTAAVGVVHDDPTITSGDGTRIDVAVHPADGTWGAVQQISPASDDSNDLSLGFDAAGNLTATFEGIDPGVYLDNGHTEPAHTVVLVSRPAATGVWTAPQDLTDSETDGNYPTLAVAPDGTAVVALTWDLLVAPLGSGTKVLTRIGADGTWTEGDLAPMQTEGGDLPEAIGISPDDTVYVVYGHDDGTSSANDCTAVERASLTAGSPPVFSAPQCLSALNFGRDSANIAFIGNDAYFGWIGTPNMGTNFAFETSRWLESESAPEPATDLATPALDLFAQDFMSDQNGSVAAIWTDTNDPGVEYDSAFDAGGPGVTTASVPTTAAPGQPVTMSATFADLWSGVSPGGPTWDFGDGTTATGAQVTHTYATAGTYTITVGATDTLGNKGSATYTITVATPPPPPTSTLPSPTTSTPAPATTSTPPPATTSTTPTAPAAVKPELTAVKQSAAKWRESGKASKHRPQVGTSFSFKLNTTATVRIAVTHSAKGRKSGKKCVQQTTKNTKAKPCSLTVTLTTLTVKGRSGANKLAYRGAVGKHGKLKPGTYTATLTASDTAGKSKTAKLKFTVLKA